MSKTWLILLIVGVVLMALFIVAAVAAFLFLPANPRLDGAAAGTGPGLRGRSRQPAAGQTVDMDKLVRAVNRRLNSGWNRLARVRGIG